MNLEARVALLEQTVAELRGLYAKTATPVVLSNHPSQLEVVLRLVRKYLLVPRDLVLASGRSQPVINARWAAIHLLSTRFFLTGQQIGELFGQDKATVNYARREIVNLRAQCPIYSERLTAAEQELDAFIRTVQLEQQAAA